MKKISMRTKRKKNKILLKNGNNELEKAKKKNKEKYTPKKYKKD